MSLFRKQNKVLIIQTLFGLLPYRINHDRVEFHLFAWIYSFILHCTVSIIYSSVIISYVTQEGFRRMFLDSRIACRFLQIVNLEFVYYATVVGILFNIRKYARFFNKLNKLDRKVDRLRKESDNSEGKLFNVHVVICTIYLFLYLATRLSFMSTAEVVSSFCYTFKIVTITFVALFMRQIASTLNNKMGVVIDALDATSQENCRDVHKISECIATFSELSYCKQIVSTIFGMQLFLCFFFDFIGITIILYLSSSNVATVPNSSKFSYILYIDVLIRSLVYVLPVVIKEILLVHEMDKLGQTVHKMRSVINKFYISNGADGSEDYLELLILKLKHMERKKYVTANGYLPINYSILYKMVAAIVTSLMILLQFKQWEDNLL